MSSVDFTQVSWWYLLWVITSEPLSSSLPQQAEKRDKKIKAKAVKKRLKKRASALLTLHYFSWFS